MNPLGRPRIQFDDAWIVDQYSQGCSESHIARNLQTSRSAIHRRLVNAGIPLRTAVEASDLRRHKEFPETEAFVELLDGILLGDGCITDHQRSEARLEVTQRKDCQEWLEILATDLKSHQVDCDITQRRTRNSVQLRTRKYYTFTKQHYRWYPDGVKLVPKDVRLTPKSIAHWYWGDGCSANGYRMIFHTEGFSQTDVHYLQDQFASLYGIAAKVRLHRGKPQLHVSTAKDRQTLLSLIEPYCPKCFRYKLLVK